MKYISVNNKETIRRLIPALNDLTLIIICIETVIWDKRFEGKDGITSYNITAICS